MICQDHNTLTVLIKHQMTFFTAHRGINNTTHGLVFGYKYFKQLQLKRAVICFSCIFSPCLIRSLAINKTSKSRLFYPRNHLSAYTSHFCAQRKNGQCLIIHVTHLGQTELMRLKHSGFHFGAGCCTCSPIEFVCSITFICPGV